MTERAWGPDQRRAAVSLRFDRLAGAAPESPVVSPALPHVLDILAGRDLPATFFVEADVVEQEQLALTMIANARHEIGAVVEEGRDPLRALAALEAAGRSVAGLAGPHVDAAVARAHPSLRYLSAPGIDMTTADGLVRIPFDPAIAASRLVREGGPSAWHAAMQVAIAGAVEQRRHVTLPLSLDVLERGDTLGVLAETLDLIAGLRRAGSLWAASLAEVADTIG